MAGTLKISLALSGGAARGAFHLGVIAAMERNNVEIAAVSGASIGAVIAAGVGSGVSAFDLLRIVKSRAFRKVFHFNYFRKGLLRINEKAAILKEIAPIERLEQMSIPTFMTCVDLPHGEIVRFSHGNTINLAIASSALIPIFRPITYDNYTLIDGGFMDNLPVAPLLELPYPVVSVNLFPLHVKQKSNFFSSFERAIYLSILASSKQQIEQSDLCISDPTLNDFGLFTFRQIDACFELGYRKGSESILTFMAQKSIMKPF
ncbi:putative NTE family protein [Sulfurospirillum diekertiae]|uniref:NTE family protein n=1 Tax=Sulfurospirillum diekertiae TaxID=1854492 RepID=A0A1Y0HN74_9BACT|nr:patatin-like phospholipase family protein [Sulfurospirillum diekertiae]ARU49579.1 putative NTE family protein [Sulfurospirillum diekertiae]